MANDALTGHFERDELEAYVAGDLSADREIQVEEHLAECLSCTQMSRAIIALDPLVDSLTAKEHGDAVLRSALESALGGETDRDLQYSARLTEWRTRWAGLAEAAVHIVLDAPIAASRIVASQVRPLIRPDATLRLAEGWGIASGAGARTRSIEDRAGDGKPSIDVQREAGDIVVHLRGLPTAYRSPLVVLVPVDPPGEHRAQELARDAEGQFVARFASVAAGTYLVAIEPLSNSSDS
jgi:anti-sigma factor RsiW